MAVTGWTWDEARRLPYHAYLRLKRFWQEVCPPLAYTMSAFAGWKPQRAEPIQQATPEEIFGAFGLNPNGPVREVKRETKVITF
jgi:hypothetical protein